MTNPRCGTTAGYQAHLYTLADVLVPIAAELVGCVRDYGPDEVTAVLARVPQGRFDALAVVLASMVDPDARPTDLLAWTRGGPVKSRDMTPTHLQIKDLPRKAWGRRNELRREVARLTVAGLSAKEIGVRLGITPRSVNRHRAALRNAAEMRRTA